ncbi:MAG: hypothetical protein UW37_C0014G0020 [Candidatus Gottesmanbacteria bacterium GW2011_GWA2_44_17]|uniref:Peptidase S11 D-alanyl-D-alanine carboxypeptidase A N-terminal domain-containing protein n=3 Tax=Candidatus Gottesmaniibacteriota TaxID=1752720 RepID=A0A0G1INQ0_9BACT|nr:MAG: hypothetical protein UV63_C0020G0012 [Microgenomates group bacterium GW2011_GWC1_43_11]KKT38718.1 MAG: hypothetical protein UW22_C0007G0021 [Candidatus Gottesmanbacteria bacterium GW2011_GWB1_44_11c]KKT47038.1 MAG: hypothetical protein UW37_C0014G0020 [Candidatus Gottesmanbacteria bacterium GW2011_GWA2_44_17]KKT60568.1 MAG: hypothetical protein UW52_C0023G0011 [Candidatus Gottesmanbacteria bacterium GW2011_GWA1_44_24b]
MIHMARPSSFFHYSSRKSPFLWLRFIFLIFLILLIPLFHLVNNKKDLLIKEISFNSTPTPPMPIPSPAPYPVNTTGVYPGDEVSAAGVVVVDVDSHVYLYKRNDDMLLSPASTTKLMTALVALDVYNLEDVVTVASVSASGQSMGLIAGEKITVENLLYGALIQSGNDAAFTLAQHYPQGGDKFIDLMNKKAQALHMDQSYFTNPMGFDGGEHKVTPRDLSLLALAAIQNKTIAKMVAIPQITVSDVNHVYFHKLSNINQLLGKIPGVGGIKTGWTEAAGENLITYVERNNRKIILVVLHSRDRFGDTIKLIDWVFDNYRWEEMGK